MAYIKKKRRRDKPRNPNPERWDRPRSQQATNHIMCFSGGIGSWAASKILIDEHGEDNVTLLFADTKIEDEDLYRFLEDSEEYFGFPITRITDGRTPWELFFENNYLGNSRVDSCSVQLKREFMWDWIYEFCDPAASVIHFGIDFSETHRIKRIRRVIDRWAEDWKVSSPLIEHDPPMVKQHAFEMLKESGIDPPRLYAMGFQHNNCGGFCVRAGQMNFATLLENLPERYRYHAEKEQEFRETTGKNVAILRDRRGGKTRPLPLLEFQERLATEEPDKYDWGGCGCALY